ncbi:uncharacterized protein LOC132043826 [Lycium ferocissimum]|uniref:uncharacterized protein LOC132043826 n=1 Tax=Lycium ferocissimum TaxID=112874 RepID=UPI002815CE01|nr:uncharacterized protein LOC132043826 [Lycium ferocissimum]
MKEQVKCLSYSINVSWHSIKGLETDRREMGCWEHHVLSRIKLAQGLPKGSVEPKPEPTAEPAIPASEFDTARASRLIVAAEKRQRKPSAKGQKKKRPRSDVWTLRDESESDIIIRRVGAGPFIASVPEEETTILPSSTAEEGTSIPTPNTGGEEDVLFPIPLRSIEFIDISGDASPEVAPLVKRPRRSGPSSDTEADQRAESAPDNEAIMVTSPLPGGDQATTSEAPVSTEAAGAVPISPTPTSRSDNLEDMFSDIPSATREASGFGHLPIPRATRAASRSTKTGARDSLSVVLVNEGFVRAQHEVDDLKGQLDAQGRETEKFQLLPQEKEDQLSRAAALPNLQSELEASKAENLRLKAELADMIEKNRLLEADNFGLNRDNANFITRLGELEAIISQLRSELDSIKADAVRMAEGHHQLESESANDKEKLKVADEKAKTRARISDELKSKLEEATEANDVLQAEFESANQIRIALLEERSELEAKLKKAEANLEESLKDMETAEARSTILIEYERWKLRRVTLEQIEKGLGDLQARILEAKESP